MNARALILVTALPVLVSLLGVGAMLFNRSDGRAPFTLSEREAGFNRVDGGSGVTLFLSWSPKARAITPEYRRGFKRRSFAAFTIDETVTQGSRLVPVDQDPDPDVLARRYPDGRTHVITAVTVSPDGTVMGLEPSMVGVPRELAASIPQGEYPRGGPYEPRPRFTVDLRYGRRWEPWVVDVRPAREGD